LDSLGDPGDGAHERPRLVEAERFPAVRRPVQQVVCHPDGVEALCLPALDELAERRPSEQTAHRLADRKHEPDLHAAQSTIRPMPGEPGKPPFKHSTRTRVGFSDTDAQGIVYYGRYNPYFDLARVEYLRRLELLHVLKDMAFVMRANT